jgi:hypothetical protein
MKNTLRARTEERPSPCGLRVVTPVLIVLTLALFCRTPDARAASHRYALSVFHFNIQYVAGGLVGLFPDPVAPWELNNEQVEDTIVLESFEPVLDLYLAHPSWGTNLEMQAYFLEVLAERHPTVLEKLRELSSSGQAEVVSFHYSDQLFLAYPRSDLERSLDLTRQVFERYGIPLSASVFCQEGQASPAMPALMERYGYEFMVWPKNLYRYQHGTPDPVMPYYTFGSRRLVLGPESVNYDNGKEEIQVRWTFLDDGELLATGDWDPYFPPFFKYDPQAVAEYEQKLLDLEAQGFRMSTVGRYVQDLQDMDIPPADPGPLLEGTWQPDSTNGIFRWMGAAGLFGGQEKDNYVRTLCAAAHRELEAAETLAAALPPASRSAQAGALKEAWRLLFLAQVSDATGINPFRGEIDYGISHASEALRIAREVIEEGKRALGVSARVLINTETGKVLPGTPAGADPAPLDTDPLPVSVDAPGRRTTLTWRQTNAGPDVYRLDLDFSPVEGDGSRTIEVTFPGDPDRIVYCPSLQEEEPVSWSRGDFIWEHFILPLPNGLIGLGEKRWLIKDTGRVHVGAFVFADGPEISFRDETAVAGEPLNWRFYLMEGTREQAVSFANRLNIWPELLR